MDVRVRVCFFGKGNAPFPLLVWKGVFVMAVEPQPREIQDALIGCRTRVDNLGRYL